jgi:hypothetical protein
MLLDLIIIILVISIFVKLYSNSSNSSENFTSDNIEVLLVTDNRGLMYRGRVYSYYLNNGKYIVRLNNSINICESSALAKYRDSLYSLTYDMTQGVYLWFDISNVLDNISNIGVANPKVSLELDKYLSQTISNTNSNKLLRDFLDRTSINLCLNNPLCINLKNKKFELRGNKLYITPDNISNYIYCNNNKLNLKGLYYDVNRNELKCVDNSNKMYVISNDYKNATITPTNKVVLDTIMKSLDKKIVIDETKIVKDSVLVMDNNSYLEYNSILYKLEKNTVLKLDNDNGLVYNYEYDLDTLVYVKELDKICVRDVNNNWFYLGYTEKIKGEEWNRLNLYLLKILTNRNKNIYLNNSN